MSRVNHARQRVDGRNAEDFRQPCLQQGVLSNAQGSAYVETGKTKVMVGIFGPRESDTSHRDTFYSQGRIAVDVSIVKFPSKPKVGPRKTPEETELARMVQASVQSTILLEKFPKLVLDINCSVLEQDGNVASAIINAATLALADAGIEMRDMVSSCSVALLPGKICVVDPSGAEEVVQVGKAVVSVSPIRGEVTFVSTSGRWEETAWNDAVKMAIVGCAQMDYTMREHVRQNAMGSL
jgi:exosome complex component MTR3